MGADATVDVIVLNYRNVDLTCTCLASVDGLRYQTRRTIVIDNGSADGSADRLWFVLKSRPDAARVRLSHDSFVDPEIVAGDPLSAQIVLVEAVTNHGYGAGVNAGLRFAGAHHPPRYTWVLNNDVVVHPDSLGLLVERAESDSRIGLLGCDERRALDDGSTTDEVLSAGGFLRRDRWTGQFWSNFEVAPAGSSRHRAIESKLVAPNGAAVFVSTEFLLSTGLFPDYTFLSYEELDLGFRARRNGFGVGYSPDARIWHRHSATSPRNEYLLSRARILVARRHRPWTLPVALAYVVARAGRMSLSPKRRGDIWPSVLGTFDGLRGNYDRYPETTPLSALPTPNR